MRLIIPLVIIALGGLFGAIVCYLFKQTDRCLWWSVAAGATGSFVGLVVRDMLDITAGGPGPGALLATLIGAVTLALPVNIYFRMMSTKQ